MSSAFRIVPIAEAHINGFRAAVDSVAREKRYLAMVRGFPLKMTRQYVRANIRNRNPHFIALSGGRVIGWCDVQPSPRDAMAHGAMLGMGIVDGFRSQGIGSQLMRATLQRARKRGLTRVELTVRVDNRRAIRLYRKFGFKVEGLHRKAMKVDGKYYNMWSMAVLFKRKSA